MLRDEGHSTRTTRVLNVTFSINPFSVTSRCSWSPCPTPKAFLTNIFSKKIVAVGMKCYKGWGYMGVALPAQGINRK